MNEELALNPEWRRGVQDAAKALELRFVITGRTDHWREIREASKGIIANFLREFEDGDWPYRIETDVPQPKFRMGQIVEDPDGPDCIVSRIYTHYNYELQRPSGAFILWSEDRLKAQPDDCPHCGGTGKVQEVEG